MADDQEPLDWDDIRASLRSLMWRDVGVRRERTKLQEAAETVDYWCRYVLPRQFDEPEGWQLQNMLSVSRLIISAALLREESRGVHLRSDFPTPSHPHWNPHLLRLTQSPE